MNHTRQRKKSTCGSEDLQQRKALKDANISFKANKFLVMHHTHILTLILIGVFVSLYFFFLSSEEQMLRASAVVSHRSGLTTGLASAHSAQRIIKSNKPFLVYGTAWKKERTAEFVNQAVHAGFRFIDTACQPRHYNETGVGEGWSSAASELNIPREEFYLQTKFTPFSGQDPNNIPYNPESPLEEQVRTSLTVSLTNLKTDYLDCLVLHSPLNTMEETMQVWRVMESFVDEGKVHRIGLSNSNYLQFSTLYEMARIKPSVAQNRFHAETGFDTKLRHFCRDNGIWYQSFWTLTANRVALGHNPEIQKMAEAHGLTPQTLMFAFLMSTGYITPLSGTTSKQHMAEDVAIMERIQGGEVFFHTMGEMRQFSTFLGMPEL
ncbi:hypothetical protein ACA910_002375 [Epithemia clementina (nom. ined.)]